MGTGTEIGRVRGLGSAKSGAHHWWTHRLTAGSNFLLMLWFLFSIARLPSLDYKTVTTWLGTPLAAVPMILLVISVFWHFRMGLQTVIEDYVHGKGTKIAALVANTFFAAIIGAACLFSVLKIAFSAI